MPSATKNEILHVFKELQRLPPKVLINELNKHTRCTHVVVGRGETYQLYTSVLVAKVF